MTTQNAAVPAMTGAPARGWQRTGRAPGSGQQPDGAPFPWRYLAAAALLAGGQIWWSATPTSQGGAAARIALVLGIVAAAGSLGQLAVAASPEPGEHFLADRIAARLLGLVRMLAWPEFMTVAVIALEALHRSRPWHTAVLGAAVIGFLLAVHLAESRAGISVLRRQLPLVGIGLGLSALAAGAAALPSLPPGGAAAVVRIIAATAGVAAAGLAVPVWLSRSR